MPATSKEAYIILALEALENDRDLKVTTIAKLYYVDYSTLRRRRAGRPTRRDTQANSRCLMDLEKQTIVQYITELATRAFPPTLRGVEDIANYLQRERDALPVGKQ